MTARPVSSRALWAVTLLTVAIIGVSITVGASGAPTAPALAAISVSSAHSCVVTAGGGVKCWGSNDYGQLGDGMRRKCGPHVGRFCAQAFHRVPLDVVGLASGVESVAAGGTHTCALTRRGGVKCWGYNASGQLGNGAKLCLVAEKDTCARYVSSKPVDVVGLKSGVEAIAAGEFHSCALTKGGGVKCWGSARYGQLGTEASGSRGSSIPLAVDGLASGVSAIAAGSQSTCALTSKGAVKCWGVINGGYTPVDVPGLASGATAISVGWTTLTPDQALTHGCALTSGGGAKCWGDNGAGQLGDGSRKTESYEAVDVVGLGTGATTIEAGAWFTCALTRTGRAKCWGAWLNGQSRVPADVPGLASEVTAISAGSRHACVLLRAGGARCWGSNEYGRLGNGSKTRSSSKPVDVNFAAKPSAKPPPPGSGTAGRCSKASAREVVRRLRLGEPSLGYPVADVLCGAFTGRGSQTMVVTLAGPTGPLDWVVFRSVGGAWQFLMRQPAGASITAAGSDIRQTVSLYRPSDSRCCPTGGTKSRLWHWNGSRFVASPWKQETKGEPEARGFDSPSLNINCGMFDDRSFSRVVCQSRVPPQRVILDAAGRMMICRDPTPNDSRNECNLGDRGEGPIRPLAYGRQITVGRFRCLSLEIGVRCTVIRSGRGFLINRDGVTPVGP